MSNQQFNLLAWIRLSRPANLLMVMICTQCVRLLWWLEGDVNWLAGIGFMTVAVFITAGGNILNDYYDVRVDKLNRPDKMILSGSTQRKKAILAHVVLTTIAMTISLVMALSYGLSVIIIPLFTSALLWAYSPVFKKKFLIGNVLVAACVGVLPIWSSMDFLPIAALDKLSLAGKSTCLLSICACLLTLAREIVKDMEDAPGDHAVGYKTLAIVWPIAQTKRLVHVLVLATFLSTCWFSLTMQVNDIILVCAVLLSGIPLLAGAISLHRAQHASEFAKPSRWLKWASLGGILFIALNAILQQFAAQLC